MADFAASALFKRLIANQRARATVAAATVAMAAAAAGGFVLFSPRPSDAASTVGPVTIPTTPAEIRADMRKHELGLAAKGLAEYRQELVRTHQPSLSAAERAAELNRLEKTVRAQLAKPLTRAPAVPAGLHPDKSGAPAVPAGLHPDNRLGPR